MEGRTHDTASQGLSLRTRRRIGLLIGGILAYMFGGPVGLVAGSVLVFIVRLLEVHRRDT